MRRRTLAAALLALGATPWRAWPQSRAMAASTCWRLRQTAWLMAVHDSAVAKREGHPPRLAYLYPERYAQTRWVAYQQCVPAGTVLRVLGPAPAAWDAWQRHDAWYVALEPAPAPARTPPQVILAMSRGLVDPDGGPHPAWFEPLPSAD